MHLHHVLLRTDHEEAAVPRCRQQVAEWLQSPRPLGRRLLVPLTEGCVFKAQDTRIPERATATALGCREDSLYLA